MRRTAVILAFVVLVVGGSYAGSARSGPGLANDHAHRSEQLISSPLAGRQIGQAALAASLSRRLSSSTTLVPAAVPAVTSSVSAATWACVREAESGDDYSEDTGNGYFGAYQFSPPTWNEAVEAIGLAVYADGRADLAPAAVQDAAARWLQAADGWGQWGARTRSICGLW